MQQLSHQQVDGFSAVQKNGGSTGSDGAACLGQIARIMKDKKFIKSQEKTNKGQYRLLM
jgi:hypothetical protein